MPTVALETWYAERAARAREEARALAAEAELARVRAEAQTVREFYEQRELRAQERIIALRERLGGEMLRADMAEERLTICKRESDGWLNLYLTASQNQIYELYECGTLRAEVARLEAVVALLQATRLEDEEHYAETRG